MITAIRSTILKEAEKFVLKQFKANSNPRLTFHNYQHTSGVVQLLDELGANMVPEEVEIARLAAWFQDLGYLFEYQHPNAKSVDLATKFLRNRGIPAKDIRSIIRCINAANGAWKPDTLAAELLVDANNIYAATTDFEDKSALLRLEQELLNEHNFSEEEWLEREISRLHQIRFYTPTVKAQYDSVLTNNIVRLKNKRQRLSAALQIQEQALVVQNKTAEQEEVLPIFYQTRFQNHFALSATNDRRATMLVFANTIMIGILVVILNNGGIHSFKQPILLLPFIICLVTTITSLIVAILSTRPKGKEDATGTDVLQRLSLGSFQNMSKADHATAMHALAKERKKLFEKMTSDLHELGKQLEKRHQLLQMAYNIFLVGLGTTLLVFLLIYFFGMAG